MKRYCKIFSEMSVDKESQTVVSIYQKNRNLSLTKLCDLIRKDIDITNNEILLILSQSGI